MKFHLVIVSWFWLVASSCNAPVYLTNGEMIYYTGENNRGETVLNRPASRIKIVSSCRNCHGKYGDAMKNARIGFSQLSNSSLYNPPYNDSLFFRFLDHDVKSDGTKANIGVIWNLSDSDKKDLLDFLKTL